jgi:uroporphyrinogen-III decarboxylase
LLEYLGEAPLFYALHDQPGQVRRLLELLDQQMQEIIQQIALLDVSYVEFPDNLHGLMTNPRLFQEFCLPAYQKYCDTLHRQGKKVGSHTDGNMRSLLKLLTQTGLDVCESFSPYPLTDCTFEEAWHAWETHPMIWGAIPSTFLEEQVAEEDFHRYLQELLSRVDRPIILGIVDLFMRHNSIERVAYIASCIQTGRVPVLEG